jgi:hypothetical protein
MRKKRIIIFFTLLTFCASLLFGKDTLDYFSAVYEAETSPYFTNSDTYFPSSYVAKIGELQMTVTPTSETENVNGTSYKYSDYLRMLYFHNSASQNIATLVSRDGTDLSFTAHLMAVVTCFNNATTTISYNHVVDVTENSASPLVHQGTMICLLDKAFLNTPSGPTGAIDLRNITTTTQFMTVTFYLKCMESDASPYINHQFYFDTTKVLSFSSTDSLSIYRNYGNFEGTNLSTVSKLAGDLAFFPSDHYNKPLSFGAPPSGQTNVLCWVQYDTLKKKFDLPSQTSTSIPITKANVILYGSGVDLSKTYKLHINVKDTNGSATDGFRLLRVNGSSFDSSYKFDYDVSLVGATNSPLKDENDNTPSTINWGQTYTWSGIIPGNNPGTDRNWASLAITNIDKNQCTIGGTYRDTLIITVTAADAL